jgi:hypothetical protein
MGGQNKGKKRTKDRKKKKKKGKQKGNEGISNKRIPRQGGKEDLELWK